METIKFTLVDPNNGPNKVLTLYPEQIPAYKNADSLPRRINLDGLDLGLIDPQQMFELGVLFVALAGDAVDHDSAGELLDGFEIDPKKVIKSIKKIEIED